MRALDAVTDRLAAPLSGGERARAVAVLARIATGLVLLHQALDSLGFVALLGPQAAPAAGRWMLGTAAASALLVAGLMTPLALGWLIYVFAFASSTGSLGNQVTLVLLWGLLLLNAGRFGSADALLARRWPRLLGWLYALGHDPVPGKALGLVRLGLLVLFWGVCLVAMVWHARDDYWRSGEALPMALTGPFYSDWSGRFRALAEWSPGLFWAACAAGLAVQSAWEVLLVPLVFWKPARWFVRWQGVGFFACSVVLLNLQYLPVVELCLWLLLFGDSFGAAKDEAAAPARPVVGTAFAFGSLAAVGLLIGLALAHPSYLHRETASRRELLVRRALGLFGQRLVSVFNKADLELNRPFMVIHEVDGEGRHLRLVPCFDTHGTRLRYMRNDILCYHFAIPWQHAPIEDKFLGGDPARPGPFSLRVARSVSALDARLNRLAGTRRYRVEIYRRELLAGAAPSRWGKAARVA
ncbi:MAG: hypothetical protein K2W96_12990, partial [Gemmataceae bacterium]|nr:hypothetical protein [Gemmataceae bacterium]